MTYDEYIIEVGKVKHENMANRAPHLKPQGKEQEEIFSELTWKIAKCDEYLKVSSGLGEYVPMWNRLVADLALGPDGETG